MKKREAMSVGEIIKRAIEATGHADDYDRQKASYIWADVVGPAVARYTTRRWVEGDTLHVCLTSAPLKHELSFHTERLADNINRAVGRAVIRNIVFH